MKYTWWILLTIAGILSLTSVYGFILCLGSFGMLALNVMWLFVYTPHKNSKALESISKPTIILSIIGTYAVFIFMSILFYFVMKARFMEIGIKLYGEPLICLEYHYSLLASFYLQSVQYSFIKYSNQD